MSPSGCWLHSISFFAARQSANTCQELRWLRYRLSIFRPRDSQNHKSCCNIRKSAPIEPIVACANFYLNSLSVDAVSPSSHLATNKPFNQFRCFVMIAWDGFRFVLQLGHLLRSLLQYVDGCFTGRRDLTVFAFSCRCCGCVRRRHCQSYGNSSPRKTTQWENSEPDDQGQVVKVKLASDGISS